MEFRQDDPQYDDFDSLMKHIDHETRWIRRIIMVLVLTALFITAGAFFAMAHAHSWYSKKHDPVYMGSCCGGSDCKEFAAIPDSTITAEATGYRIRLTFEQARAVNPNSVAPIDALVTYDRVQPSEDGNWHICIMSFSRGNERGGIYCLFAPPDT